MLAYNTDELKKRFIVIEGIDGAGTTTQMKFLAENLRARGYRCATTAEPTERPIGRLIRSILSGEQRVDPTTVAYLFASDRNEHLFGSDGIVEQVESGSIVICDRYALSSLAYQGLTCGEDLPLRLNGSFPAPGLTLLFDIDPEVAIARINSRPQKEIYETLDFQKQVCGMYRKMADRLQSQGWNIARIEANTDIETVHREILSKVFSFLGAGATR